MKEAGAVIKARAVSNVGLVVFLVSLSRPKTLSNGQPKRLLKMNVTRPEMLWDLKKGLSFCVILVAWTEGNLPINSYRPLFFFGIHRKQPISGYTQSLGFFQAAFWVKQLAPPPQARLELNNMKDQAEAAQIKADSQATVKSPFPLH
jgi:hypothetical protein